MSHQDIDAFFPPDNYHTYNTGSCGICHALVWVDYIDAHFEWHNRTGTGWEEEPATPTTK